MAAQHEKAESHSVVACRLGFNAGGGLLHSSPGPRSAGGRVPNNDEVCCVPHRLVKGLGKLGKPFPFG